MSETTKTESLEDDLLNVDEYELPVLNDEADTRYPAFIAGNKLIVRLEYTDELQIPLVFSYKQIQKLRTDTDPDADELEQLIFLLELISGTDHTESKTSAAKMLDILTDIDLADALAVGILFFRAWKQRTQVTLGKLRGSSLR